MSHTALRTTTATRGGSQDHGDSSQMSGHSFQRFYRLRFGRGIRPQYVDHSCNYGEFDFHTPADEAFLDEYFGANRDSHAAHDHLENIAEALADHRAVLIAGLVRYQSNGFAPVPIFTLSSSPQPASRRRRNPRPGRLRGKDEYCSHHGVYYVDLCA